MFRHRSSGRARVAESEGALLKRQDRATGGPVAQARVRFLDANLGCPEPSGVALKLGFGLGEAAQERYLLWQH